MTSSVSTALRQGLGGSIARWWLAELSACVPGGLRRALGLQKSVLLVEMDEVGTRFSRVAGGRVTPLENAGAPPPRGGRVVLRLAAGLGLRKQITLPLAAEENLRQVLEFEMERQTPFRAEQVYFYHQVLQRRPAEKQVIVRLSVVPRRIVTDAVQQLARLGLKPAIVDLAETVPAGDPARNLLPAAAAGAARGPRLLLATALVLALAAIVSPLLWYQQALRVGAAEIAAVRPAAERAMALRRQIDDRLAGAAQVTAAKAKAPLAIELIEELTRLIPDDAWVSHFGLANGRIELQGIARSAAGLVPLIEQSPRFAAVEIRAPIVREVNSSAERFHFAVLLEAVE